MKTENEVLEVFFQTIMNELMEQRGVPVHITCKVTDLDESETA